MKPAILIIVSAILAIASHALAITNGFDSDLEGWFLVDVNGNTAQGSLDWNAEGGNPGGCAEFTDEGNDGGFIGAPTIYLGDWSAYNGVVTFTYDHTIFSEGSVTERLPYEVRISGPGGEAQFLGATPSGPSGWHDVEVVVSEYAWNVLQGSWASILEDVTSFRIRIEQTSGHVDISGIDNIEFPVPTAVHGDVLVTGFGMSMYPNPCQTSIEFTMDSADGNITLEVYDLRGRRQFSRRYNSVGSGPVRLGTELRDDRGARIPTGQYIARIKSGTAMSYGRFTVLD
jgi:hypothetical protein